MSEKSTCYSEASSDIRRKVLVQAGVDVSVNAVIRVITAPDESFSDTETRQTVEPRKGKEYSKKGSNLKIAVQTVGKS
ncbi:MAG: hypothetical protein ABR962_11425 [Candidatus Bathyarchaeia archaeon]|jgi:hypothetical protein